MNARSAAGAIVIVALACSAASARAPRRATRYRFEATAFSREGITRVGTETHYGIVAADRHILPLGTVIRVTGAGRYSGTFIVTDTGDDVRGRHIDIYVPNQAAAKDFGKKIVHVRVLKWGDLKPGELARSR